ncbi:peptidase T [Ligilactobacillus equi]|uniref:Peptidase T n=1 Tax=Ligilactobacillus equi DPC 6820 TaxID=1392007 RepID=V7HV81_9LACO|nr:peptidase T [Ligilactobacillus equi]ETA73170.1 tripeptide aminopeptidase [Ligilactobacillus equi DPC 6820]
MEKYENLIPRFLKYVKVNTRSDEASKTVPSTPSLVEFAKNLAQELEEIGLQDVQIMDDGYVFATLPSNLDYDVRTVGFISHFDTADFNAENVNPQIVENYDGQSVINLDAEGKFVLDPAEFPSLKKYQGHTLITTDGLTLLGADDKAGDAEIITAMEYLIQHPEIKHGPVKVAFGPDEEIGTGADNFHVKEFGADFAYTVDAGPLGELEYETFNAAQLELTFHGKNVHPGSAKGLMINALQLAVDFQNQLPANDVPEKTDGRQGFYHLLKIEGTVEEAKAVYIIRDHDRQIFEARKKLVEDIVSFMNEKAGRGVVSYEMYDQYYNMREILEKDMSVVEVAKKAMENLDIKPIIEPVRGGTDGSKISFLGLPTPNFFAGGENMHGRYEYVSTTVMVQATDTILEIIRLVAAEKA